MDAIKEEEVTVSLDKLREISESEEAFAAFFRDMRDHCVRSLGFVPKREKLRIQAVYQELADAIYPHVARIKKAFDAGLMAEEKGLTGSGCADQIKKALDIYGLPSSCRLPVTDLTKAITLDKKNLNGKLNVVLLKELGSSYVYPTDISFFNKGGAI